MNRLYEDPSTRRVVDTNSTSYRLGQKAANTLIAQEFARIPYHVLTAEVLTHELLAEDPDLADEWSMYVILKAMLDTFHEYQQERSS